MFDTAEVYGAGGAEVELCVSPCSPSHVMPELIKRIAAVASSRNSNSVVVTSSSLQRSSLAPARDPTTPVSRGNSKYLIECCLREVLNVSSIIEGTKESLQRLKLDYVDIIFAHRPDPTGKRPYKSAFVVQTNDLRLVPIEETVRAFNYVIEKGWVRIIPTNTVSSWC